MAQFVEFISNLLFLRRNFVTNKATEVLHETVHRCLIYKRKISIEFTNAIHVAGPFENMLDFVNYTSSQYTCTGDNHVVTSIVSLCKNLNMTHEMSVDKKEENVGKRHANSCVGLVPSEANSERLHNKKKIARSQNFNTFSKVMRHEDNNKQKLKYQDYIVDNLHAILKSQEFLFKNIIKLVHILEKDPSITMNTRKLRKIKHKLIACRDVLTENTDLQNVSNLISNIIEEEITRCRFRHGECKTSAEISLKQTRPEGIAIVLEATQPSNVKNASEKEKVKKPIMQKIVKFNRQHETLRLGEIKSEITTRSKNLIKSIKPQQVAPSKIQKQLKKTVQNMIIAKSDLNTSSKLIEINQQQFNQFENALWHSLTTLKFISLKDEYLNQIKCAFHNRKQFLITESALSKQIRIKEDNENFEKFLSIISSMFHITERKILFDELKDKMKYMNQMPYIKFWEDMAKEKSLQYFKPISRNRSITVVNTKLSKKVKQSVSKIIEVKEENQQSPQSGKKTDTKQSNLKKYQTLTEKKDAISKTSHPDCQNKAHKIIMEETLKLQDKVSQNIPIKELADKPLSEQHEQTKYVNPISIGIKITKDETPQNKNNQSLNCIKEIKTMKNLVKKHNTVSKINETKSRQFGNCQTLMKKNKGDDNADEQEPQAKKKKKLKASDSTDKICKDEKLQEHKVSRSLLKLMKQGRTGILKKDTLSSPGGSWFAMQREKPFLEKKADIAQKAQEDPKCVSDEQLKHEADLIKVNQKMFDEMEGSLHTVQNFEHKDKATLKASAKKAEKLETSSQQAAHSEEEETSVSEKTPSKKTSTKNKKNPVKKEMSTQAAGIIKSKHDVFSKGDNDEALTSARYGKTFIKVKGSIRFNELHKFRKLTNSEFPIEKRKTFLKSASHQCILNRDLILQKIIKRSEHTLPKPVSDTVIHTKSLQMRRTTKAAMKKQQVLTISPKFSSMNIGKKSQN